MQENVEKVQAESGGLCPTNGLQKGSPSVTTTIRTFVMNEHVQNTCVGDMSVIQLPDSLRVHLRGNQVSA